MTSWAIGPMPQVVLPTSLWWKPLEQVITEKGWRRPEMRRWPGLLAQSSVFVVQIFSIKMALSTGRSWEAGFLGTR